MTCLPVAFNVQNVKQLGVIVWHFQPSRSIPPPPLHGHVYHVTHSLMWHNQI